jgi:type I restriction enzyme M protein
MATARGDKEIGDKMNKIIAKLAEANDLKGVIDVADFNNEINSARARRWWTASPT